jgi:hypothetical protein
MVGTSKPRGQAPDIPINKDDDAIDIIDVIDSMFESATVTIVLAKFYAITDNAAQVAVVFASMAACKGVAANAQAVFNKIRDCPDAWKIGQNINMTWLALLGHVIYAIPAAHRIIGKTKTWGTYTAQTGLSGSLWEPGSTPQVSGKDEKNQVLQKYKMKTQPSAEQLTALLAHLLKLGSFDTLFKA